MGGAAWHHRAMMISGSVNATGSAVGQLEVAWTHRHTGIESGGEVGWWEGGGGWGEGGGWHHRAMTTSRSVNAAGSAAIAVSPYIAASAMSPVCINENKIV